MKIKKINSQNRRDFYATYICEHCGHEKDSSGYDDQFFHTEVIPNMVCEKCGKKATVEYIPQQTKYPEYMTV